MPSYAICTTQRSGKTWLAHALRNLDAGDPREYLTSLQRGIARIVKAYDADGWPGFMRAVRKNQTGAVGITLHWNDLARRALNLDMPPEALLSLLLNELDPNTKVIFMRRRDVVAQAVSQYFLQKTGRAHSFQPEAGYVPREEVEYDANAISRALRSTLEHNRHWESALKDKPFYTLVHEDMVRDPTGILRATLRHIGIEKSFTEEELREALGHTKKLGDAKNEEFKQRFLQEERFRPLLEQI